MSKPGIVGGLMPPPTSSRKDGKCLIGEIGNQRFLTYPPEVQHSPWKMAIPIGNIFQPPFMRGYVSLRECTPCALYLMNCFDFITPVKPIYFLPFKTGPLIQLNIFPITSSARNRGLYSNISKPGADARSENA